MLNRIKAALTAALVSLRDRLQHFPTHPTHPTSPAPVAGWRFLPLVPEGYHVSAGLGANPAARCVVTVRHIASGYKQTLTVPDCIFTAQDHIDAAIDMVEDARLAGLQAA